MPQAGIHSKAANRIQPYLERGTRHQLGLGWAQQSGEGYRLLRQD